MYIKTVAEKKKSLHISFVTRTTSFHLYKTISSTGTLLNGHVIPKEINNEIASDLYISKYRFFFPPIGQFDRITSLLCLVFAMLR